MTRRRPANGPRAAVGQILALALIPGAAALLLLLAARNFAPSVTVGGLAGGAIGGWSLRGTPAAFGEIVLGFDLAAQANLTAPALVVRSALNSAILIALAWGLAIGSAIPLGFWLALRAPRSLLAALRAVAGVGVAFPAFFAAFLLQVAAVEMAGRAGRTVLPVYGFGLDAHLVIPVIALALAPSAYALRFVALAAAELNVRDFVRTARAKGVPESSIVYRHILPNMVGAVGEAGVGALRLVLSGLVIVEYLLVWPGLGVLALRAANVHDLTLFLAAVSILASVYLLSEIALDLVTRRRGFVTS